MFLTSHTMTESSAVSEVCVYYVEQCTEASVKFKVQRDSSDITVYAFINAYLRLLHTHAASGGGGVVSTSQLSGFKDFSAAPKKNKKTWKCTIGAPAPHF